MPRLPSAEDLGARVPRSVGSVTQISDAGIGQQVARAADRVQRSVQNQIELDNQFRFSSAETKFLIGQEKVLASLQDADYETYADRYREAMREVRKQASEMIRSPRDLQAFENRADVMMTRGELELSARAKARETDVMRGHFENDLSELGDVAMTTSSLSPILQQANDYITGAIRDGYVKAEEGESVRRKFASDVAMRRLEMMPAEARIAALNNLSGVERGILPEDVRQALIAKSQAELVTLANRQRTLQRQAQEESYERAYEAIIASDGDLSKIRMSDFPGLRPSQYHSLQELAAKKSAGYAVVTDPDAYYEIKTLLADQSKRQEATDFPLSDFRHLLSESDYKTLTNAQAELAGKMVDQPALDIIQAETAIVQDALRTMRIPQAKNDGSRASAEAAQRSAMFTQMVEQRKAERLSELRETNPNMKRLPQEELRAIVDQLTTKVVLERPLWFDREEFAFEQEVPETDRQQIIEALQSEGRIVSEAAIRNLYIDMQRARGG